MISSMEELTRILKERRLKREATDYKELVKILIEFFGVDITLKREQNWQKNDEWDINYYASFNGNSYIDITETQYDLLKELGGIEEES